MIAAFQMLDQNIVFPIKTAYLFPGNLARSRLGIHSGADDQHATEEDFIDAAPIGAGDAPGSTDTKPSRARIRYSPPAYLRRRELVFRCRRLRDR